MTKEKKHPLDEVVWGPISVTNYRGCNVVKNLKTGLYSIFGKYEVTAEEVDGVIDESIKELGKSIKQ